MRSVINHLIQLQELSLIRDEQKITKGGKHQEELNASINAMVSGLPGSIQDSYVKLAKKDHLVVVPVSEGVCAICRMKLPISLVQIVRIGKEIRSCPNCARLLYYPESAPRHVGRKPRRSEPRKPGISRFSSQLLMVPKLESTDKEGVINELAYKMEAEGFVNKAEKLVEAALRRETILSTAVDHGLAFPHARGVEGGGLTLTLGISKKGIDFDSPDKVLTKLVFFMVIPTAASAFYLKLLAGLTETFMKADARKAIITAKDQEKLWKTLIKVTRAAIK
ncbi:PTS sugar transporter subunit IIA [Verrucomicrobiota bacterium]